MYNFWNEELGIMNQLSPCGGTCNDHFVYWWHAHVIDVLADGYLRTKQRRYLERIDRVIGGVLQLNGSTLLHNYYDDMEWMALALLRVYDATGHARYLNAVRTLWESIQTAWNDHCGGGMAWKKDQPDYKNTPANAPACILAARLFQRFGHSADYDWAVRIYEWTKSRLVDEETGFVWDGMNRLGDGRIDKDWAYTYCQGVYIGAGLELYRITGRSAYMEDAVKTAQEAIRRFGGGSEQPISDEGPDDCGLFKGIFVRYLRDLYAMRPDLKVVRRTLLINAQSLWTSGRDGRGRLARSWGGPVETEVQLSAQLSGLMAFEMTASLLHEPEETSDAITRRRETPG
uniref:Glycosyl hydrolase n=2 Tax=Cohnella candidum TaxID=2674991 RepID=A0A3G3K2S4_9BACL|nr:glycosyl hydrolase [Cohnella candidum]